MVVLCFLRRDNLNENSRARVNRPSIELKLELVVWTVLGNSVMLRKGYHESCLVLVFAACQCLVFIFTTLNTTAGSASEFCWHRVGQQEGASGAMRRGDKKTGGGLLAAVNKKQEQRVQVCTSCMRLTTGRGTRRTRGARGAGPDQKALM